MLAVLCTVSCQKDDENIPSPVNTPRTEVPDEIVGAWEAGTIGFVLWENYHEGYYAGWNAIPSREAMVFNKNGDGSSIGMSLPMASMRSLLIAQAL